MRDPLAQTLSDLVIPRHPGRHALLLAVSSRSHGVLELLPPPSARAGVENEEQRRSAKGEAIRSVPLREGGGQRQTMTRLVDDASAPGSTLACPPRGAVTTRPARGASHPPHLHPPIAPRARSLP